MKLDDQICYCFHVSLRKLVNYARRECPQKPSQLSDCLNAGTGCGWCIPILKKIHARAEAGAAWEECESVSGLPDSPEEYADARKEYLKSDTKNTFEVKPVESADD
jgi:NAD(P)H-nitrite reductase large subunit